MLLNVSVVSVSQKIVIAIALFYKKFFKIPVLKRLQLITSFTDLIIR